MKERQQMPPKRRQSVLRLDGSCRWHMWAMMRDGDAVVERCVTCGVKR